MTEDILQQIRRARGKFIAMAVTYSLGVFNDQFFKQAAFLMAIAASRKEIQGYATIIFSLPYIVFAAYAGWMADRFSKRHVVIGAKVLELAAMICGAIGILSGNWTLILLMVGLMGLQSAIFAPALNGSIPELYPASCVTQANAYLKMVVTGAILLGVASAGFALHTENSPEGLIQHGEATAAIVVVLVSALGVVGSLGVPRRPAAAPQAKFPWAGPLDTIREHCRIRKDRLLANVIGANAFLWFTGSLLVLLINPLGKEQLGRSESVTSGLVVAMLVGIAVGGLLISRISKGPRWHWVLPPTALAMSGFMWMVTAVPLLPEGMRLPACFVLLGLIGVTGGAFLIPCESFIQVRPAADHKGTVIAASNFAVFVGILLSGLLANVLNAAFRPTTSFVVAACLALFVGVSLLVMLPRKASNDGA